MNGFGVSLLLSYESYKLGADMARNRRCSEDAENSALASPGPATDDRTSTSPYAIHCRPRIREYFLVVAMRIDSSISMSRQPR